MKNRRILLVIILVLSVACPAAPLLKMQSDFPERAGGWLYGLDAVFETYEYALCSIAGNIVYYGHNNNNEVFRRDLIEYLAKHENSPPRA